MDKLCLRKNSNHGFSMIEMIVALAVFSISMVSAMSIMEMALRGQMQAIAALNVQESLRYALETMSKELRNVGGQIRSIGDCTPASNNDRNNLYSALLASDVPVNSGIGYQINPSDVLGVKLAFRNKYNECVLYYLDSNRIKIDRVGADSRSGYITPLKIRINNFKFIVKDDHTDPFESQPSVTMVVDAEMNAGKFKQRSIMQTTVTARYYTKQDLPE